MSTWETSAGAPTSASACWRVAAQARDVSGASSEGFQTTGSPQTRATAVFQDHTAAGKLKALITPTTPSGCQVSISRWPGRSDGMVRPYSWRDSPTAKSQMSTISWISPRASEVIFPTSRLTSVARSSLCSVSSSAQRFTSAPRVGAGTLRHSRKAACARWTAASTAATSAWGRELRISPLTGEDCSWSPLGSAAPTRVRASWARVAELVARGDRHDSVLHDVALGARPAAPNRLRSSALTSTTGRRP